MSALLASSPDAALLTLTAGILLAYFECNRPGAILPGCLGALLTLLSIDAFAHMPLRPAALALCAAGTLLVLAELLFPLRHAAAAAGTVLVVAGFKMMVPTQPFAPDRVHLSIAIATGASLTVSTLWLARIALRARRNKRSFTPLHAPSQRLTG